MRGSWRRPWCRCVFDQFDEGKRATKAVCEDLKARRRGLEVVLPGLTASSFLGILSAKLAKLRVWRLFAECGYMGLSRAFVLSEIGASTTRLVIRAPTRHPNDPRLYPFVEPADSIVERSMLRGIEARAEAA